VKCSLLDGGTNEMLDCFTSYAPVDQIQVHGNGYFNINLNVKLNKLID